MDTDNGDFCIGVVLIPCTFCVGVVLILTLLVVGVVEVVDPGQPPVGPAVGGEHVRHQRRDLLGGNVGHGVAAPHLRPSLLLLRPSVGKNNENSSN